MSKMRAMDDGSGGPADFNRTRETEDDVEGHVSKTRLTGPERRRLWDLVVGLSGLPDPAPDHQSVLQADARRHR